MTSVVCCDLLQGAGGSLWTERVDLFNSTLSDHFGKRLTFSYYHEVDHATVLAGMSSPYGGDGPSEVYFVKLVENEPQDLEVEEMRDLFNLHPEFIPHTC